MAQAVALEAELVGCSAWWRARRSSTRRPRASRAARPVSQQVLSLKRAAASGSSARRVSGRRFRRRRAGEVDAQGRAGEQASQAFGRVGDGRAASTASWSAAAAAAGRKGSRMRPPPRVWWPGVAQHDEVAAAGVQRRVGDDLARPWLAGGEAGFSSVASSSKRPPGAGGCRGGSARWRRGRGRGRVGGEGEAMSRRWAGSGVDWLVSSRRGGSSTASLARLRAQALAGLAAVGLVVLHVNCCTRAPGPWGRGGDLCRPPRPGPVPGRCRRRWCWRRRGRTRGRRRGGNRLRGAGGRLRAVSTRGCAGVDACAGEGRHREDRRAGEAAAASRAWICALTPARRSGRGRPW